MITKQCLIEEVQHLIEEYILELSSPIDSFLEEHIQASAFYMIKDGSQAVGYYAIHNNELLTQFYIRRSSQMQSQWMFNHVIEHHACKSLFVPTCDELFLSLAIDKDFIISKQAYFFQESHVDIPEIILDDDQFRIANMDDLAQIQQISGEFLDQYERRIANGELFTYYRGNVLHGIGVIEKSKMFNDHASIGMLTNEAYRKQGIGKSIILLLRKWCRQQGIKPISGCWYYNEASKRTLESAGMVTKTRLLNIKVTT